MCSENPGVVCGKEVWKYTIREFFVRHVDELLCPT